jgi:hypothetical protein
VAVQPDGRGYPVASGADVARQPDGRVPYTAPRQRWMPERRYRQPAAAAR